MDYVYAKIENGLVVNTQVAQPSDYFDPNDIWIDITNIDPQPCRGWTYDGTNFIDPNAKE